MVLVTGKQDNVTSHSPMTKITGNNAKCVLSREERCEELPELSFRLAIYCTNEDGNDGYIQPPGMISLKSGT